MSSINYKSRISNLLDVEKVAYQNEICRRIDIMSDRTIKFVIKEMSRDGELEESQLLRADGRIRTRFYWKPSTDLYTRNRVIELKLTLLRLHMEFSNVQQNFGPRIAKSSMIDLTNNGILPLIRQTIQGPIKKWAGPLGTWRGNEVTVPSGDVDVIANELSGNVLWLGEVKMRGDYTKKHQIANFTRNAKNFRDKIFSEKGIYYALKLFFVAPLFSVGAIRECKINHVERISTIKAYYPRKTSARELEWFYSRYKTVMGFGNLELIDYTDLPIQYISMEFQRRPFSNTI